MPCLLLVEADAQSSTSVREEMYKRYLDFPSYVKGGKIEPHWEQDGSSFWFHESDEPGAQAWRIDPIKGTKTRIQPPASATGRKQQPDGAPSPDGRWIAFMKDFNLFLQSADGEQTIQLTEDGRRDPSRIDYFRFVWSPDGSKLAARRNDYAGVPCYPPLPDWLEYPVPVRCNQDTVTGQSWPRTEVVIFDVENRGTVRIQPDEGFYLDYRAPGLAPGRIGISHPDSQSVGSGSPRGCGGRAHRRNKAAPRRYEGCERPG